MAFFEDRLPDCYSFGARGGPVFSTEVVKTTGGQRSANRNWLYPLHRYDISAGVKNEEDFGVLRAFFYNVQGQFDGFRFKDWADYTVNDGSTVLVTGSTYQLRKDYTRGVRSFHRPIYKPVSGKVAVYRTRSGATTLITPTVSYTAGTFVVTGHINGDVYTWDGEFDVPVAFTNDALEYEITNKKQGGGLLINWPQIMLEEIRQT